MVALGRMMEVGLGKLVAPAVSVDGCVFLLGAPHRN